MLGRSFERLCTPMCARPSNSFLIVLGCFFLALLHLFSQSANLSTPPDFRSVTLHEPILPPPYSHYDALLQLAKETQMPFDSLSLKDLQMFESDVNVPSSTQDLMSTPTQIRALDVAIAKKPEELPYEGFEASILAEVKVSKLTGLLANYNAGSEDLQSPYAMNSRNLAPSLDEANVMDDQTLNPNEVQPITNSGKNNNFLQRFVTMLGQASNRNLSRKASVQKERLQENEELQQKYPKPTTNIPELKEDPKQEEFQMLKLTHSSLSAMALDVQASENKEFKDNENDELVSEPRENEAIKLNDVIKEPIDPHEHVSPQPSINSTAKERLNWLKNNWDRIKILNTDYHDAEEFSTRMDKFLTASNTGVRACELRFFMIWIAPLSAFGPREKLALESVFASHPSACLVILSRMLDSPEGHLILNPLTNRGFKILTITPHIPFLVQSTPAEKWFKDLKEGLIDPGTISINQNLSNLLRLVVLYKYGGVYIDNDIIVMKSFANFSNVIGAQNIDRETGKWNRLNNAVMVFEKASPLLLRFIEEFYLRFNGSKWGHNGPYLVSRVVMKEGDQACKVMDPSAFYPVDWDHIGGFFQAPRNSVEKEWVVAKMAQLSRHSFSIHLWNKFSRDMEVEPGSIMDSIFQRFCLLCNLL